MSVSVLFGYLHDDGRRDVLFGYTLRWWKTNFPDYQICVGRNFDQPFHRGKARNDAFVDATGDTLIIADADTIPTVDGVTEAVGNTQAHNWWTLPYGEERYYNLTEEYTNLLLEQGPDGDLPEPTEGQWDHRVTSWAGCLILPRGAFVEVGGYDERFVGWGGEDNAFQLCLDSLWGQHCRVDSYVSHLWHPRGDADFSQPNWPRNQALLRRYQKARTRDDMHKVRFT